MSGPINFRLRKGRDDDIKRKLDNLPEYIDNEFIRRTPLL